MVWKDAFQEGKELTLATSSLAGVPHATIVLSVGWTEDRLLMADCQMHRTMRNLQENPRVCVIGEYIRLQGTVELRSSGPLFDRCKAQSQGYTVRHAIVVTVEEVMDLDNGKVLEST